MIRIIRYGIQEAYFGRTRHRKRCAIMIALRFETPMGNIESKTIHTANEMRASSLVGAIIVASAIWAWSPIFPAFPPNHTQIDAYIQRQFGLALVSLAFEHEAILGHSRLCTCHRCSSSAANIAQQPAKMQLHMYDSVCAANSYAEGFNIAKDERSCPSVGPLRTNQCWQRTNRKRTANERYRGFKLIRSPLALIRLD
jgi:hypothetical protein